MHAGLQQLSADDCTYTVQYLQMMMMYSTTNILYLNFDYKDF